MKLVALLSLVFCSVVAEDYGLRMDAPVVQFPSSAPRLVLDQLPKKIVDPTHMIRAAAARHKVKPALVKGIVAAESAFNANAISAKGAVGLMQLMPETAEQYGVDPLVPEQNIEGGTRYLHYLIGKYSRYKNGLRRAIAAYNAGPGVVDRYRGVPPYKETKGYVTRVLTFMRQYERERG